jgi:hypothetical protein
VPVEPGSQGGGGGGGGGLGAVTLKKVPPRFELRLLDSKSRVITTTLRDLFFS